MNGELIMGEVEVRLQPLRNFEAVREPAKTEEQKLYRTENGVINDIETQVYESKFINIKLMSSTLIKSS